MRSLKFEVFRYKILETSNFFVFLRQETTKIKIMKYNDFECVFSRERLRRYVFGDNWLRDSVLKDGIFYNDLRVAKTRILFQGNACSEYFQTKKNQR